MGILLATITSAHAGDSTFGQQNKDPQEDDFKTSPYMQYGEFNEEKEEEEDAQFFQYGRFFGVSLGLGFETADGNRGAAWQGGFPLFDLKIHYWFDFNFAIDLNFYTVNHSFQTSSGPTEVNMIRAGIDVKYYFDTQNIAAPISFANPYVVLGVGEYTETQTSGTLEGNQTSSPFTSFAACVGAGFEFAIKPKKTYFTVEGKVHFVHFDSDNTTNFVPQLQNTDGNLYTGVAGFLFTW